MLRIWFCRSTFSAWSIFSSNATLIYASRPLSTHTGEVLGLVIAERTVERSSLNEPWMSSKNSGVLMCDVLSLTASLRGSLERRVVFFPGNREIRRAVLKKPGIFSDLGDGDALHGVVQKHLRNQIAASLREKTGKSVETVCE